MHTLLCMYTLFGVRCDAVTQKYASVIQPTLPCASRGCTHGGSLWCTVWLQGKSASVCIGADSHWEPDMKYLPSLAKRCAAPCTPSCMPPCLPLRVPLYMQVCTPLCMPLCAASCVISHGTWLTLVRAWQTLHSLPRGTCTLHKVTVARRRHICIVSYVHMHIMCTSCARYNGTVERLFFDEGTGRSE